MSRVSLQSSQHSTDFFFFFFIGLQNFCFGAAIGYNPRPFIDRIISFVTQVLVFYYFELHWCLLLMPSGRDLKIKNVISVWKT